MAEHGNNITVRQKVARVMVKVCTSCRMNIYVIDKLLAIMLKIMLA